MNDNDNDNENDIAGNSSPPKQWEEATVKLQQGKSYHGSVILPNNNILITGGYSDGALDSTEVININKNTRSSTIIPNLRSKRAYHASVIVNNDAYVIGGYDGSNHFKSVQGINVDHPQAGWQNVANMNQMRGTCAATVHNNTIFVFNGGGGNRNNLSTVEFFDTATKSNGEWNTIQSRMAIPRYFHAAVTVGDIIYIIGGSDDNFNDLSSVEMFDTSSQTFQQGPSLPVPIHSMSAVAVGKVIIVIGGYTTHYREIGEAFFLDTSAPNPQWKIINISLQTRRCRHSAVLINNDKLCVCGGHSSRFGELDTIETISIVDLLPHDLLGPALDMTALHASCCDPNATVDTIQRLVEADPSAFSHRDATGRTPVQRFLLYRGLPGAGQENGNSNVNDNTEEEEEESLPSLYDLLENRITGNDLDILFVLKKEFVTDLLIRDESTNLVPFMSAATMSECGLDVVYSLAMGKPDVLLEMWDNRSDYSSMNNSRKVDGQSTQPNLPGTPLKWFMYCLCAKMQRKNKI